VSDVIVFLVFVFVTAGVIWLYVQSRRRIEADEARALHERIRVQREQYAAERSLLAMAQQALQEGPDTEPAPNEAPTGEWYHESAPCDRVA
jgi:hypothetical protein